MISGASTVIDEYDMSKKNPATGKFYNSTTYLYDQGTWQDSPYEPPTVQETGLLRSPDSYAAETSDDQSNNQELKLLNDKM
jgi:hypothetical protein